MGEHKKPALVTGASGFVGGALCRRLAADGIHVRAMMRKPFDMGIPGIDSVQGDLTDPASVAENVAGTGAVFHCAAHMGTLNRRRATKTTVGGTSNLVQAMAQNGVRRLIHISTAAVYFGTRPPLNEDAALGRCKGVYSSTKLAAEQVIRAAAQAGAIDATIFRPPIVYGPGSPVWTRGLARSIQRGRWPLFGSKAARWHYIYIDNLVDALLLALHHDGSIGKTYNIADGVTTGSDWVDRFRKELGGPEPKVLSEGVIQLLVRLTGGRFGTEDLLFLSRKEEDGYSAVRARTELGWSPSVPLDEGVRRAMDWLRSLQA